MYRHQDVIESMDYRVLDISQEGPLSIVRPACQTVPMVIASGHSGNLYSPDFLSISRLDYDTLRKSEDCFVDELFGAAPELGAPILRAHFPRAWCDPNREAWELDPTMFEETLPDWVNTGSARVEAGLGTLARIVASGEPIYRRKLLFSEAAARIHDCWQPYHIALSQLIEETCNRFGMCLLIDCHSMPSPVGLHGNRIPRRQNDADMVLGDLHGTSCANTITMAAEATLQRLGYAVRRNNPYAGGYVTQHYGRPGKGVHVLQIEIARVLYMDEERYLRNAHFALIRQAMTSLMNGLGATAALLSRAA
ncbi:N-formylglutamate deformylase [Granulibacter bethesdensis]|uniref:N-formylglutamate deformylase n=3 Tax=Granulibacter bethesdensis TaxID=364410 RepID=Q0BTP9_GRABC|nr:N-formylglutamate deformylase [Granulibacter bethesdensis CGDNIH1]AHJ62732.1 N-formylglutamate deformylase [Granulibacter bethesdensis]AHJ66702.1 N-formylglutamate deformylase [Granulibacter bethesdensis CGDNIH4]AHJ69370.1 N-formylglutamate deformylase [Granulibacter bethesdensis]APH51614.1 N-formylglutamate deformylase [Granulibacter bethesdensis]